MNRFHKTRLNEYTHIFLDLKLFYIFENYTEKMSFKTST